VSEFCIAAEVFGSGPVVIRKVMTLPGAEFSEGHEIEGEE
jgi:hypothetical protein